MNMDITKLSEIELKALAYEQVKQLNLTQQNLILIEQQLEKIKNSNITTKVNGDKI